MLANSNEQVRKTQAGILSIPGLVFLILRRHDSTWNSVRLG